MKNGITFRRVAIGAACAVLLYLLVKAGGILYMDSLLVDRADADRARAESQRRRAVAVGNGESFAQAVRDGEFSDGGGPLVLATILDGYSHPLYLVVERGQTVTPNQAAAYDMLRRDFVRLKPEIFTAARVAYGVAREKILSGAHGDLYAPPFPRSLLRSPLWDPARCLPELPAMETFERQNFELWLAVSPALADSSSYLTLYFRPIDVPAIAVRVYVKDDDVRAVAAPSPAFDYYLKLAKAVRRW